MLHLFKYTLRFETECSSLQNRLYLPHFFFRKHVPPLFITGDLHRVCKILVNAVYKKKLIFVNKLNKENEYGITSS